ncbi:ATP-binding protein [Actinoplanes palleronii]|uniref:Histidine kinase/HSP90-like ATPase domain-containing protein n=1 Tax=Actinoplanes palleronii TaxID=113570 RepID=A0ABQ4BPP2_9ACTN|nr:ATP-binding protein [Actinoplanes palleronii]GIE72650.1 hypothetical protein Apa02nite_087580 [Actinoplanes palleronii]
MTDEYAARQPGVDGTGRRGDSRVWELIGTHGPDVADLCRAGAVLLPDIAGLGLSAGPRNVGPPAGSVPQTRFSSDAASARLESAQYSLDEGPCRDAAGMRRPVLAADLRIEPWAQRWPRFTEAALAAGARAVFALPLHAGAVRHDGAVDLYRRTPGPLDTQYPTAVAFAAAAAELLTLERLGLDFTTAFAAARRGHHTLGRPAGAPADARVGLDAEPPAVPLARWFNRLTLATVRSHVRAVSTAAGLSDQDVARFVLAVHEAMLNAVNHGGGYGQLLLWRRDDRLWCEISDHGPGMDITALPQHPGISPDTGTDPDPTDRHGLWFIRQACTSLDITTDITGTRMLLSYRLEHASSP